MSLVAVCLESGNSSFAYTHNVRQPMISIVRLHTAALCLLLLDIAHCVIELKPSVQVIELHILTILQDGDTEREARNFVLTPRLLPSIRLLF